MGTQIGERAAIGAPFARRAAVNGNAALPGAAFPVCQTEQRGLALSDEEGGEDECDRRQQFDEDVERRPGGVLERIPDGVADDGGRVGR